MARAIAIVFGAFVLPTAARAADTSVFHDNITIARADFSRVDGCIVTLFALAFGGAALSDDEFDLDKKLASARVTKTVEMTDEATGATFEVSVDIAWTATSPATNTRLRFHDVSPGRVSNSLEKATGRDARVSGSVVVGTTDLLEGATIDLADTFTRAEHGVRVDRSAGVP